MHAVLGVRTTALLMWGIAAYVLVSHPGTGEAGCDGVCASPSPAGKTEGLAS
jgi:hypothetical protein